MNEETLVINIFPSRRSKSIDRAEFGEHISTVSEIKINQFDNEYSIILLDNDFIKLEPELIMKTISSILDNSNPNLLVDISIQYHLYDKMDMTLVEKILELDEYMCDNDSDFANLIYTTSKYVTLLINGYEEDDDPDDEDDTDIDWGSELGVSYFDDEEDDNTEDDEWDSDYKKSYKKTVQRSRILRGSKNPKREWDRHGVIICRSKSNKKKDIKTIEEILSETFIQGNSRWKKRMRRELAKRFIYIFSRSRKEIRQLEREMKKEDRNSSGLGNVVTDVLKDVTRRIASVQDPFYDPKR